VTQLAQQISTGLGLSCVDHNGNSEVRCITVVTITLGRF